MDLRGWLRGLGLEQYESAFRENAIDDTVLPSLTTEDLKDLGVGIVGHRRKLLNAIAALRADANAKAPPLDAPATLEKSAKDAAERRQVTVMFSDLVGSTALSAHMDPEDLREVISAYQKCVAETVRRFGGFVAKYMGDGVLVYFGYPQAHEDDAELAVRAALELIPEIMELESHASLRVRVGIATGLVVVGDLIGSGEAQERGIIGETPNLAARLQAIAEPGQVVISEDTQRLTGGLFEYRDLGRPMLKGLAEPVQAWQVVASSGVQSRFEAQHGTCLAPLVGREEELDLLMRRWRQAVAGEGRVVLLTGEAGIGKSRLTAALREKLGTEPSIELSFSCSSHHSESALFPIINQLERSADFVRSEPAAQKLAKLEMLLARSNANRETVALIADLLSVQTEGRFELPQMSPQKRKEKILAALLDQFDRLAARQPVCIIFEDAHWIDPTSLELLALAVERAAHTRLLLVITARPEFAPPWPSYAHVALISLTRLSRREGAALVNSLVGGKTLPLDVMDQILSRTDGVPLFLEELTKTLLESGLLREDSDRYVLSKPLPLLAIPTTLHASLMARLDRSALVKEIAQIGAAIGREFSYALLRAVAAMDERVLNEALSKLEEAELASCRGKPPEATYSFKHALVQDTAYASLIRSRRQDLHRQIAMALRDNFSALADAEPEIIAHHFTEAAMPEPAIEWWAKAGEQSLQRSALTEATSQFRKAIELADALDKSSVHLPDRLRLQIAYGQALMASKGYGAPETTVAFARARELAASINDSAERFSVYYGLWVGSFTRGELTPMRELSAAFLRDVETRPELPEAANAHRVAGVTQWFEGAFSGAHGHLERAVALSDVDRDRGLAFSFGQDPGIAAKLNLALALVCLGEIAQSRDLLAQARAQAVQDGHVPTIAYMHGHTCFVEGILRAVSRTAHHARKLEEICHEHDLQLWAALAEFFNQWTRWHSGDRSARIDEMRAGINFFRQGFQPAAVPIGMVLLAEVEADAGRVEAGLNLIDDLLIEIERTGQRWFDAEVYRQRAELLQRGRQADAGEVEAAFQRALEIAREQRTKLFELRAASGLARLWRQQDKRTEARDLLTPVYALFTQGLDTGDLKDAKALLDALA